MEGLLQYIWQHKLWLSEDMVTNDGRKVRVIDPGLLNTDAGPDFFNAKVEIDGRLWVGNVEIHVRASDWKRHHHDEDPAYDSVILHVVEKDDAPVARINGEIIPQVELKVSPRFNESYDRLVNAKVELPCAARLGEVPPLTVTEWIEALAFERLHGKVDRVRELYDRYNGSWEDICYVMLARTLGFGINNDAFERLARVTPLRLLHKHSDSILQVEALLFGQAGLLGGAHADDAYYQQLMREYAFLANKFSLRPIEGTAWRLFRSRPQNFPYRRIALLAQFVLGGFNLMNDHRAHQPRCPTLLRPRRDHRRLHDDRPRGRPARGHPPRAEQHRYPVQECRYQVRRRPDEPGAHPTAPQLLRGPQVHLLPPGPPPARHRRPHPVTQESINRDAGGVIADGASHEKINNISRPPS